MPKRTSKPATTLREKALGYLARREHSHLELRRKLRSQVPQVEDAETDLEAHYQAVDELLEDFSKRGWLSAERFTEQLVHARQGKFGSLKIAHELREKGIDDSLVEHAVAQVKENELANARTIWRRKYAAAPSSREEWAKQARFLQSRGFGFEVIKQVLADSPDETL